jgi:hypothetical protein
MTINSYIYMILLIIFILIISFYNEYTSEHSKEGFRMSKGRNIRNK